MKHAWAMLLLWALLPFISAQAEVRARDGVLDLRGQDLSKPIRAQGTWDFYWKELLTPADLKDSQRPKTSIKVPGIWSQDPAKYETMGYATYRLKVLVDPGQKLGLFMDASIWSASRIFLDGTEVAHLGKVGTTADTSEGGVATRIFEIEPKSPEFDLIIQVSNFEIFLCGITIAPQFGSLEVLSRDRNQKVAIDVFIVGGLVVMGVYHLCLFLLRTEDPSTLWFASMVCFTALWHATSRNGLIMLFFPDLGFDHRLRIYNSAWVIGVASYSWYFYYIFRGNFSRRVCQASIAISLAFVATTLVTSSRIFVGLANVYHFFSLLLVVYVMKVVYQSWRRREEEGRLMIFGLSILAVTGVHDILAIREIISSPMLTAGGLFGFIIFQSFILARRFSNAFVTVKHSEREIRSLSEDLKTLNNNLEKLVEEKTRDIRSIMEHIPVGILMIQQNRKAHKDHSKKVYEFFDRAHLETADVVDLMLADSDLTADQKSQAISCMNASLGEDVMNFSMNQEALPLEMVRKEAADRLRVLELTWDPIVTTDNRVDKILVTMRDVTDLRRLQQHNQEQQKELEYIAEIMNTPPERFQHFLQTTDELLEQCHMLMAKAEKKALTPKQLKLLFINMHTLKGLSRSLYLKNLSHMFHDAEQTLIQAQNTELPDLPRIRSMMKEIQKRVDHYKFLAQNRLGRNPEKAWMVEYSVAELEELYHDLKDWQGTSAAALEKIRALFHGKVFKDARAVFEELFSSVLVLARDLGKEVPRIALETGGICLSQRAEQIFRKIFIHLIRNAMDHGLESADERRKQGKDPVGTIRVTMQRVDEELELQCMDDGRGLHLRRIQDAAVQAGILPEGSQPDPMSLAALIFHPGMSTARELSDISGRGIGMNAILAFVEQNEGSIAIELVPPPQSSADFAAFRLIIRLPFQLFEEAPLGLRAAG
ncbi:MAG TPA: 7TM diverse intracellular signaling domain-containing protein [Oligoflexus sp.]|uniref:7TM diverse intracellular signaling domain-containing protein n=1 Tax=Oligoflexus sp. TaxID=1971216 RepID=UPI002D805345|nr:7TM diverse intracellular signaling domain-containing protein [Oligoflexus sp.]HET9241574.1 7TM diverse intracellular signaling domain-containing protein [Oligoflexus sp.]